MTGRALAPSLLFPGREDTVFDAMDFLSEVAERYPDSVSFAAGRPSEEFFAPEDVARRLVVYRDYLRNARGLDAKAVRRTLMQYGPVKGVAREVIAEHLLREEGIRADPEALVITVGCQEALFLVARALRRTDEDVLLAVSPTYAGFTGAAALAGVRVLPVADGSGGIDLANLERCVPAARAQGLRPRALYIVPDFANPSGATLDLSTRHRLLDLADALDVLVIEDSPYRLISGPGRLPSLKSLDTRQRVVHVGSFAKTVFPGVRVGYCVADQRTGDGRLLADHLAKVKSMVTVNTSPITQAVVAGALLENDFRLESVNSPQAEVYRRNLSHLLDGLAERFGPRPREEFGVEWNTPGGGFFVVLSTDFLVTDALLEHSASRHRVLWTPLRHFFHGGEPPRGMRLSGSSLTPEEMDTGLDRLAALVTDLRVRSTRATRRGATGPSLKEGTDGRTPRPTGRSASGRRVDD